MTRIGDEHATRVTTGITSEMGNGMSSEGYLHRLCIARILRSSHFNSLQLSKTSLRSWSPHS